MEHVCSTPWLKACSWNYAIKDGTLVVMTWRDMTWLRCAHPGIHPETIIRRMRELEVGANPCIVRGTSNVVVRAWE